MKTEDSTTKCLLSTGNCKISDFSEGNHLRGLKIEFFPWSTVKFILALANKTVRQGREIGALRDILPYDLVRILDSTFLPRCV